MHRVLILIILEVLVISCSNPKGGLEEKTQTIELTYITWACDCANWATPKDLKKYSENIDNILAKRSVFIEPSNRALKLPDTLGYSNDIIKFTGRFYKKKGFPKNYSSYQNPEPAKVFQYTDYKVLKSNYQYSQKKKQEQI